MSNNEGYVDILVEDMRLDDPELKPFDGKFGAKLPPGTYLFEVADAIRDKSKKGNPMIVVDYKVISEGEFEGETMKQYYTLDPNNKLSRARLQHIVRAMRVPILENGSFSIGAMIGQRIEAEVEHETTEGAFDPVRNVTTAAKTFGKIVSEREVPDAAPKAAASAPAGAAGTTQSRRPVGNANGTRQTSR